MGDARAGVRSATAGTPVGAAAGSSGSSAWLAGFPAGIWGGPGEGVWSGRGLDPWVHGQDHPSARAFSTWSISSRYMGSRGAATARSPISGSLLAAPSASSSVLPSRQLMLTAGEVPTYADGRPLAWASIAGPGRSRQMTESTDIAMGPVPPVSGDGSGRA